MSVFPLFRSCNISTCHSEQQMPKCSTQSGMCAHTHTEYTHTCALHPQSATDTTVSTIMCSWNCTCYMQHSHSHMHISNHISKNWCSCSLHEVAHILPPSLLFRDHHTTVTTTCSQLYVRQGTDTWHTFPVSRPMVFKENIWAYFLWEKFGVSSSSKFSSLAERQSICRDISSSLRALKITVK